MRVRLVPFPLPMLTVALVVLWAVGVVDHAQGRTRQIVYAKTFRSCLDEYADATVGSEGSGSVLSVRWARQVAARRLGQHSFHRSLRRFWMGSTWPRTPGLGRRKLACQFFNGPPFSANRPSSSC